ncbi:MAG: sialate O-acetylesterase [Planctomycetes bacterium]|nr:sialate O-acetylesterase [Planctomycetota bacterium]
MIRLSRWLSWALIVVLFSLMPFAARADVRLPAVISDHMVLQQDIAAPIWGWADNGEEVTVSIAGQSKSAKAGADGKWLIKLDKREAGGPYELIVKGKNTHKISDVLIGEVWLGSGQSNMAMTVSRSKDFEVEQAAANLPNIRMFRENSAAATEPQEGGSGKWEVCSPETVGSFSATAFFFGRELHTTLKLPVGLINSSVGGTPIEAWTSMSAQKDLVELKPLFARWDNDTASYDPEKAKAQFEKQLADWKVAAKKARDAGKQPGRIPQQPVNPRRNSHHPAVLFNGKIAPLIPYAIRGAIWYQGESNANSARQGAGAENYGLQLRTLIADWRGRWGQGDFPVAWVQLPLFHRIQAEPVEETGWTTVREQMLKTLRVPNTGMAITLDLGEANDIHPKDKQGVGKRLALWALAKVYNQKGVVASGPLPDGYEFVGEEVVLSFRYAAGLKASGEELKGFAIAGADQKWLSAKARVDGEQVIVWHPDIQQPKAVRYAWADNPDANLINGAGLPASPFRTDGK